MYTIGDLVRLDEHITEQSVVQIDFYTEHERNLTLLKNFVFARSAPEGMSSNLDILHRLREAALTDARENIFCIIANYGQGKSHFGLVLANYFGRDVRSEEFRIVMDKIARAEDDGARVQNLREFREARKPYLVIRLRGDSPLPLDQQFLQAMQNALREAGVDGNLPLWYQKAAEWLEKLPQRGWEEQANEFLQQYNMDLPALIERVRGFDPDTYNVVNQLHETLFSTRPHFEGGIEPQKILDWLVKHYCRDEGEFGGILILFDEFSLFVQNYFHGRTPAGTLQHLLEAVDKTRRLVLFVAFAQHDPDAVARSLASDALHEAADNLQKEIERIPKRNRIPLHAGMERVISGYLMKDREWEEFLRQHRGFDDALWEAKDVAVQAFPHIYTQERGWNEEEIEKIVCRGCFPLHPLTTAILCNVSLAGREVQTETPRTVLGFVCRSMQDLGGAPIAKDSKPNWIYPVALVDYFGSMMPEREYGQYREALRHLEGEASPEQNAVLKSILLLAITQIPTRLTNFVGMVASLSGYDEGIVEQVLDDLTHLNVIREDNGKYFFWATPGDIVQLNRLKKKVVAAPITDQDISRVKRHICGPYVVDVDWGHSEDWQAAERILWIGNFTPQKIRDAAPPRSVTNRMINDAERGVVIRLLATNERELKKIYEIAEDTMDEAFPDNNAPAVLLILPEEPTPDLPCLVRWLDYLGDISAAEAQQIGERLIEQEKRHVEERIQEERKRFRKDRNIFVVPKAYRERFRNQRPQNVREALEYLYRQVYRYAPDFFKQYKQSSTKLAPAVTQVCKALAEDTLRNKNTFEMLKSGPGGDCVDKFLKQRWGILGTQRQIQEPPSSSKVWEAWKLLDETLLTSTPARVAPVLVQLMNPPFGYDIFQLALLLSAWYGFHRRNIELSSSGQLVTLNQIWKPEYTPNRFIEELVRASVTVKKRDLAPIEQRIDQLEQRIESIAESPFTIEEAREERQFLEDTLSGEVSEDYRARAEKILKALCEHLQKAETYEERYREVEKLMTSAVDIVRLMEVYANPKLPDLGFVKPELPSPQEVRDRLLARIREKVDKICEKAESLNQIEEVGKHQNNLQSLLKLVQRTRNQDIQERIQRSIRVVQERAEQLRQEVQEAPIVGEMRAMDIQSPLATLRRYQRRLTEINPQSQKAQEVHQATQQQIDQAIRQSEERIHRWIRNFRQAQDRATLEHLLEEIRRYWMHYENTPEMKQVEETEDECKQVLGVLEQIEQTVRTSPTSPREVDEAMEQLKRESLQSEHPAVQNAVVEGERRLQEYAQRKAEEALRWLQQQEQDAQLGQGDALNALLRRLDEPPAFLPDSERGRLERLKTTVQQRIDEDAAQSVRVRLHQIRDRQKLLQLREEIDRLLRELDG